MLYKFSFKIFLIYYYHVEILTFRNLWIDSYFIESILKLIQNYLLFFYFL